MPVDPAERVPWQRLGESLLDVHHVCGAALVGVVLANRAGERVVVYVCPLCDGSGPVVAAALAGEHL